MSVLGELLHERRQRPSIGRMLNTGAVLTSVGLLVGMIVWGYSVVTRDVSGVPVVRALEGPSRIAPENPQGDIVDHQGLSVNQVQAEGSAGDIAERIRLAPGPGDLRDSDLAPAAIEAASAIAASQPEPSEELILTATDAAVQEVLGVIEPVADVPVGPIVETPVISADVPGVTLSPIPPRRPESLVRPASAVVPVTDTVPRLNTEPEAAPVVEVAADALPAGTRLVQLGSFDTAEEARAAWDAMAREFGDIMQGKQRVVLKGNIGAAEFWRLRAAGFESRADAQRFCAVIDNGKSRICIPVPSE